MSRVRSLMYYEIDLSLLSIIAEVILKKWVTCIVVQICELQSLQASKFSFSDTASTILQQMMLRNAL